MNTPSGLGSLPGYAAKRIDELTATNIVLEKENIQLKGILAKSSLPCIYCGLVAGSTGCASWPMSCGRMHDVLAATEQGESK
jgi:hypothetical protein